MQGEKKQRLTVFLNYKMLILKHSGFLTKVPLIWEDRCCAEEHMADFTQDSGVLCFHYVFVRI